MHDNDEPTDLRPGRGGARPGAGRPRLIGPKKSEGKPGQEFKAKKKAKKHKWPKRECTHEKPAFANGKLRKMCFDCYPKPDPKPRKQFTWKQSESRACNCCGNEFVALGPNLYCSEQCKALKTKEMQRSKDESRHTPCSQCGAARMRTVSSMCRECYRKSVDYAPPIECRCLWCFATFEVSASRIKRGRQTGWFCSRECSFADMALHGEPDGSNTRAAWRNYGNQFEPSKPYVARLLRLPVKLLPHSLFELKREHLKIKRLLRSRNQS